MSGPEARKPDDSMLEEFLAGDGRLVRAYRSGETPGAPPALDDVVLKIARDDLGRPVIVSAQPSPARRWRLPLAAAATLVLSFSVLLTIQRDRDASRMAFEMAPPTASPAAPAAVLEEVAPQVAEPLPALAASAVEPQSPKLMKAPAAPPSVAAELKDEASLRQEAQAPEQDRSAVPGYSEPPPTPAKSEQPSAQREKRARQLMAPAAEAAYAPAPAAMADRQQLESPHQWLARIRQLQASQRPEEAQRELAAFRRAYPDYALPEEFKALEAEPLAAPGSATAPDPNSSSGDR